MFVYQAGFRPRPKLLRFHDDGYAKRRGENRRLCTRTRGILHGLLHFVQAKFATPQSFLVTIVSFLRVNPKKKASVSGSPSTQFCRVLLLLTPLIVGVQTASVNAQSFLVTHHAQNRQPGELPNLLRRRRLRRRQGSGHRTLDGTEQYLPAAAAILPSRSLSDRAIPSALPNKAVSFLTMLSIFCGNKP